MKLDQFYCGNLNRIIKVLSVQNIPHSYRNKYSYRTIWSVLNRTPNELLDEIILIDDFSDKSPEDLDNYVADHWSDKVKIIRNEERKGLIQARLIGAENTQVCKTISSIHFWKDFNAVKFIYLV